MKRTINDVLKNMSISKLSAVLNQTRTHIALQKMYRCIVVFKQSGSLVSVLNCGVLPCSLCLLQWEGTRTSLMRLSLAFVSRRNCTVRIHSAFTP